ncbi:TPA: hypothetical protein VJE30_001328 [Streptococcus pyogenes]|nr:hypothetical protein [Streptococcus pyogenes]
MKIREIKIRNVAEKDYWQLKQICKKYKFASFNQFMLDQIQTILINDGLNLYQNQFAENLAIVREQQAKILDNQRQSQIQQIALDAKLELVQELTTNWLQFMDDVDALKAERTASGGKR